MIPALCEIFIGFGSRSAVCHEYNVLHLVLNSINRNYNELNFFGDIYNTIFIFWHRNRSTFILVFGFGICGKFVIVCTHMITVYTKL